MARRAYDQIKETLEDAVTLYDLPDGTRPRTVENADKSVDGELLIPLERGTSLVETAQLAEEILRNALDTNNLPLRAHYGFETRFEVGEQSRAGRRTTDFAEVDGLKRVPTRYYKSPQDAGATIEAIDEALRKKHYRKASYLLVRVYWKADGSRPPRAEEERGR